MVVTSRKIINPNGYFSEWFLFRKVFILIFGVKTFRKNNLSEQKPFGIKTFRRNDTSEYWPAPISLAYGGFHASGVLIDEIR